MTWMPFILAEQLSLDYRSLAYILLSVVLLSYFLFIRGKTHPNNLLLIFPPAIVFAVFLSGQPSAFGQTVESMIAGYYILLVLSLYLRRMWLIVIALFFCLLSRYAIILWVPFALMILYVYWNARKARVMVLTLFILTIFCLVPFLIRQPDLLVNGYHYYTTGALAEWGGQAWQSSGELPFQLSQSYGFAIWFYEFTNGSLQEKLRLLQGTHLIICVALLVGIFAWYRAKGHRWMPFHWFLILSLKLYLLFFFAFIQVPYAYLFLTPLLVSAMIAGMINVRQRVE